MSTDDNLAHAETLVVLNAVRSLGNDDFSLAEVYAHADALARLHPANRHVHDKIRQQLQRLRDMGLVEFVASGHYRLRRLGSTRGDSC